MAEYKWEIEHRCNDKDTIRSILNDCGFICDKDDNHLYKNKIRNWKTLDIRIKKEGLLEVILHWMGDVTTETYFDYLLHSGVVIGQVISEIEHTLEGDEDLRLPPSENLEDGRESEKGGEDE